MGEIIVTAGDKKFEEHLAVLLESIRQFCAEHNIEIAVIDLGLSADFCKLLTRLGIIVISVGQIYERVPFLKRHKDSLHLHVRPFLPYLLSDAGAILWLDADIYVQNCEVVLEYFEAAQNFDVVCAVQEHELYIHPENAVVWRRETLEACYGEEVDQYWSLMKYSNAGVFCAKVQSSFWREWRFDFSSVSKASPSSWNDQASLNIIIWRECVKAKLFNAERNWCCHLGAVDPTRSVNNVVFYNAANEAPAVVHFTYGTFQRFAPYFSEKIKEFHAR